MRRNCAVAAAPSNRESSACVAVGNVINAARRKEAMVFGRAGRCEVLDKEGSRRLERRHREMLSKERAHEAAGLKL